MRHPVAALAVLCVYLGPSSSMANGTPPSLADERFYVGSVEIAGPTTIPNGGSASYTLTVNITRNNVALAAPIIGTQGPPPPRIRPALYVGSTQLTFNEVTIPPYQNSFTTTLALSCVNNEVRGNIAGSGHGGKTWWGQDDPAEVKGHLNETESTPIRVLCR